MSLRISLYYRFYTAGGMDVDTAGGSVSAGGGAGVEPSGIFLLGLFNSSRVIPSNFVIPTTGESPFFTNSYMP